MKALLASIIATLLMTAALLLAVTLAANAHPEPLTMNEGHHDEHP